MYEERSPLNALDGFTKPVAFFQVALLTRLRCAALCCAVLRCGVLRCTAPRHHRVGSFCAAS